MTSSGRVLAVERLGLSVFNYMFRLQIFCRRQSGVVENPITPPKRRNSIVLSRRARQCELGIRLCRFKIGIGRLSKCDTNISVLFRRYFIIFIHSSGLLCKLQIIVTSLHCIRVHCRLKFCMKSRKCHIGLFQLAASHARSAKNCQRCCVV